MKNIFLKFILLLALSVITISGAKADFEQRFFNGFDALPIMQGLEALSVYDMIFDHPDGRIIEAGAEGNLDIDSIKEFYEETLPQLGWEEIEQNKYQREGEILEIEFIRSNPPVIIRFRLYPEITN